MGFAEVVAIIGGVFKFWDQVVWLIKTLQKTPAEKHEDLLGRIRKEADTFEESGRPTW